MKIDDDRPLFVMSGRDRLDVKDWLASILPACGDTDTGNDDLLFPIFGGLLGSV